MRRYAVKVRALRSELGLSHHTGGTHRAPSRRLGTFVRREITKFRTGIGAACVDARIKTGKRVSRSTHTHAHTCNNKMGGMSTHRMAIVILFVRIQPRCYRKRRRQTNPHSHTCILIAICHGAEITNHAPYWITLRHFSRVRMQRQSSTSHFWNTNCIGRPRARAA